MANILIDPVIVMTPPDNASMDEARSWFENLDLWLTEALSSPFTWLYAKEATEDLLNNDRFPDPNMLFRWQRKFRLDINVSQINVKLSQFFNSENDKDLGAHLEKLGYVLVAETGSIMIAPERFAARWPDFIQAHMHELLATGCACKHNAELFGQKLCITTRTFENTTKEIEVSAIVLDILPETFDRPIDNKIVQIFPLLFTPDDLWPLINVVECWDMGEIGIRYAIKQQYKRDWHSISSESLSYELGEHFIASVMERKDVTDLMLLRILRTMAGIVADRPAMLQNRPHPLRERDESHTPQLVRANDNAKAWRITITPDGAGWRMHYWYKVSHNGSITIEFSNVLTKKDPVVIF